MSRSVKILSMAIVLAVVGALGGLTVALALPANEVDRTYFSGPDFQEVVGYSTFSCSGDFILEGQRTRYFVQFLTSCREGGLDDGPQCRICEQGFVRCYETSCPPNFSISERYQQWP